MIMKYRLLSILLCFTCFCMLETNVFGQNENRPKTSPSPVNPSITIFDPGSFNTSSGKVNVIRAYDVLVWGLDGNDITDSEVSRKHVSLSSQYVDGLGRPVQTVMRQATPNGKDFVQMQYYDQYGREKYVYLPYVNALKDDGSFNVDPYASLEAFYDDHFDEEEEVFYGINEYEMSPLGRMLGQDAPGDSWAGNGNGLTMEYLTNTATDIRLWTVGNAASDLPQSSASYGADQLTLMVTTDEEGNMVREFTDKEGRIILKQVQVEDTPSDTYNDWMNTHYVYDSRGNLRFVLPPKAVKALKTNSWSYSTTIVGDLVFKYVYDDRGRMIIKQVPGAGEVHMVYDYLDRLVLTQDANQRDVKWHFIKYDELNRPVLTGFINTSDDRTDLQTDADEWSNQDYFVTRQQPGGSSTTIEAHSITISEHVSGTTLYKAKDFIEFMPGFDSGSEEFETQVGASISGDYTYYEGYYDATFPLLKDYSNTESFEILTVNYFDDYDFTSKRFDDEIYSGFYTTQTELDNNLAIAPQVYMITNGLPTGKKVRVLGTDDFLTTVLFYDDRGRLLQTQADNHSGGVDIATTQYDFAGRILHTHTYHENPEVTGDNDTEILKRFTYDDAGRLESIQEKLNNTGSFKTVVANVYNELGELESKKLGTDPQNSSNPLETLNYEYNIRGWLKSINGDFVTNGTGSHYFGMDLSYDQGFQDAHTQLNGNITGVIWRTKSSSRKRAYGFKYDHANRLTDADYSFYHSSAWTTNLYGATRDFSTSYDYDLNGNITALSREGVIAGETFTIDDLTYTYFDNSNQLLKVEDATASSVLAEGFDNTNGSNNDYSYDENGNLDLDNNKNITDISYNHLNLPETVTFTGGKSISYIYDAAGMKLAKIANDNGSISRTDYLGGFVYENNELQFFAHEEGRVRKDYLGNLVYDFFVKDHLGNTRMTLTESQEVVEYRATMETDTDTEGVDLKAYEERLFLNLEDTRENPSSYNTSNVLGITNNETARLNGSDATRRIGPAKMLAVNAGDEVDLFVNYYHGGGGTTTNLNIVDGSDMIDALATTFAQLTGGTAVEGALDDLFNGTGALAKAYVGTDAEEDQPRAYMTYLLFNQDFEYVDGNFYQVDASTTAIYGDLSTTVNVTQGGYLYVYLSNENPNNFDVHFDDFTITHTKSVILQEDHYYPFGMNMSALSSTAPLSKPNNFKYNGKEEQTDFDLNWYDYGARSYDAQLGRWSSIDPLSDIYYSFSPYNYTVNNPVKFIDPDGRWVPGADKDNNVVITMEDGDTKKSLREFMGEGYSRKEIRKLWRSRNKESGSINLTGELGGAFQLMTNAMNDSDNRGLPTTYQMVLGFAPNRGMNYNCWGTCIALNNGEELQGKGPYDPNGVGIPDGNTFDKKLNNDYDPTTRDKATVGETILRYADQDNNSIRDGHGAVFMGVDNSGNEYVFSKNGWYLAPDLFSKTTVDGIYGRYPGGGNNVVRGIKKGDSGYYQKKKK